MIAFRISQNGTSIVTTNDHWSCCIAADPGAAWKICRGEPWRAAPSSHLPSKRPPTTDNVGIGRAVARLEDERLLRGGSRYVSDLIATSRALRVRVLRSPGLRDPMSDNHVQVTGSKLTLNMVLGRYVCSAFAICLSRVCRTAERVEFEPTVRLPVQRLSGVSVRRQSRITPSHAKTAMSATATTARKIQTPPSYLARTSSRDPCSGGLVFMAAVGILYPGQFKGD